MKAPFARDSRRAPWFRWLTRENHILSNPAADVDLPRVDRKLPRHILTASEADQIINGADINDPLGLRDRAIGLFGTPILACLR